MTLPSSAQLKVVRVIDRLIYGGPTRNVVLLTQGLQKHGFECELITGIPAEGEGDMTFWAEEHDVYPIVIPQMSRELAVRDILVTLKIWRILRRLRPDIVHTHKSKAGATGRLAAWLYRWFSPTVLRLEPRNVAIIHTFHGHIFHSYYGKWKTSMFINIERLLARITDCIVVVSEQQRTEIRDVFRVGSKTPFRIVPLGIEFGEPTLDLRFKRANAIGEHEFLIGAAGRLCEVKNFPLLLQAFAQASGENPDFQGRLAIVGDGHLRPELEKTASDLGISQKVIFTGFRSDLNTIYPELDVAALSSLNEGTPLTLIEAMSYGRAVVMTEVGGYADILGKSVRVSDRFTIWENGVSVASSDVKGYANALLFLAANARLRQEMGERARRYVRQKFSQSRLIRNMADLYLELMGKPQLTVGPEIEEEKAASVD